MKLRKGFEKTETPSLLNKFHKSSLKRKTLSTMDSR